MRDSLRLPCPVCSGTGTDTHEYRHTETNRDTCRTCGGTGAIPARTGESVEASFQASASTTLTPAGQKLADTLVEAVLISRREVEERPGALNAAATALALDAKPASEITEGLREARTQQLQAAFEASCAEVVTKFASGADFNAAAMALAQFALDNRAIIHAALARPEHREQAAAGVGAPPHVDHELKAHPSVFHPARRGEKTFEFRKDDRGGYHVGQVVCLRCFAPETGYTDDAPLYRVITDILRPGEFGLQAGYCILSLRPLTQPSQPPEAAAPSGSVGDAGEDDPICYVCNKPIVDVDYDVHREAGFIHNSCCGPLAAKQLAPQAPVADAAGVRDAIRAVLAEWFSDAEGVCRAYEGDLPDAAEIYVVAAKRSRLYLGTYGELRRAALTPPQAARSGDEDGLTLRALHAANIARQAEWCPDQVPDLSFRGNELAGETGEACNVIKKLERERQGWRGSRATMSDLAEELADVVICADLCAVTAGIDLDAAVVAKFNATSDKVGISVRLPAPVQADAAEGRS